MSGNMYTPEAWIECKKPCIDCPMSTGDQNRDCRHLWRQVIDIAQQDGKISDTIVVQAYELGAVVSDLPEVNGIRPSIQVFDFPPVPNDNFNQLQVVRTDELRTDELSLGQLLDVYELANGDACNVPISLLNKIRTGLLKIGINALDEYVIEVATSGTAEELLSVLDTLLRDYEQNKEA